MTDRQPGRAESSSDVQVPRDPVQAQLEAFNLRDIEGFLSCYAADVVIRSGDGAVLMKGRDEMRNFYAPILAQPGEVRAESLHRLQAGEWTVDEERTQVSGQEIHALIAYQVRQSLVEAVVMFTSGRDDA